DQFNVTGTASLGGTLALTLLNGFAPVAGNSFAIFTYASRTGTFATFTAPTLGGGLVFSSAYDATNLTLLVGQPQLLAESPQLSAANSANLTQNRLHLIIPRAINQLAKAGFDVSALGQVAFRIDRLAGSHLGL